MPLDHSNAAPCVMLGGAGEDVSSHRQARPLRQDHAMQKGCRKTVLPPKSRLRGVLEITASPFSGLPASLSEPPSCPLSGPAAGYSLSAPPGDSSRDRTQDRLHRRTGNQVGKRRKGVSTASQGKEGSKGNPEG